jgi:hypothetical protein
MLNYGNGDSVSQIKSADNKCWLLIDSGNRRIIDVRAAGALCDGTTDDSTAFARAVRAVEARPGGGTVRVPIGTCAYSIPPAISTSNIVFECETGAGSTVIHNVTGPPVGCWLKKIVSSGGPMLSFIAASGSGSDVSLTGIGVKGIAFDGNGLAATGIELQSIRNGRFLDNYFQNFNGGSVLDLNVVPGTPATFGDPCDTQRNIFENNVINQYNGTSIPIHLHNWLSSSLVNGGCNSSGNLFMNTSIGMGTGVATGILHEGDDNDYFFTTGIYRATGATGNAIDFSIHIQGMLSYPANNNHYYGLSANAPIIVRGQPSFPGCTSTFGTQASDCPWGNSLEILDKGNGTPSPTIEPGAMMEYSTSLGQHYYCSLPWVDPECFGAKGDGTADDLAAFQSMIGAVLAYGSGRSGPIHLPNRVYKLSGDLVIDLGSVSTPYQQDGMQIASDGSILDGASVTTSPVLELLCSGVSGGCLNFSLAGRLTVKGATNADVICRLGRADQSDLFVGAKIDSLVVFNLSDAENAAGCQINHWRGSEIIFRGLRESGTGGARGYALELRGSVDSRIEVFNPNWNNSGYSVLVDGAVTGNWIGIYNALNGNGSADTCLVINNANVRNNTFSPLDLHCRTAVNATAGNGNVALNPNFSGGLASLIGFSLPGILVSWTPTFGSTGGTFASVTVHEAKYTQNLNEVQLYADVSTGNMGSASGCATITLPIPTTRTGGLPVPLLNAYETSREHWMTVYFISPTKIKICDPGTTIGAYANDTYHISGRYFLK